MLFLLLLLLYFCTSFQMVRCPVVVVVGGAVDYILLEEDLSPDNT